MKIISKEDLKVRKDGERAVFKAGEAVEVSEVLGEELVEKRPDTFRKAGYTPESSDVSPREVNYREWLLVLDGIGEKTADDIMRVYPTRESLQSAVDSGEELPFRDDVVELLEKKIKKGE